MSDEELQEFTQDLIAPFSIHRKKYSKPHGTVARKQFANRVNKRLSYLIETEKKKALTAYKKELLSKAVVFDNSILPPTLHEIAKGTKGKAFVPVSAIQEDEVNP